MEQLDRLLDYCESIADPKKVAQKIENQKKCLRFENMERPCVRIDYAHPVFKRYSMEEIHEDVEKMMYNELVGALPQLETEDGGVPMLRANYGVGMLPSVFGAKCSIVNGNMPWCEHMGKEGVQELLKKGVPDYRTGFGQKAIDAYAFFAEKLKDYPNCREAIKFYHPDWQGPFDVAHLLFGSDIYMEMYDDPDFIHDFMALICETYIDGMRKLKPYLNDEDGDFVYHWQHLFPGKIVLRNDSAVNLSKDMFEEFVVPYDDKVLGAFGDGSMHFCGRADHWVFDMAKDKYIRGYNVGYMGKLEFGQAYLDFIKEAYYDNKKPVVAYTLSRGDLENFDFRKYRTGITYNLWAADKEDAAYLLDSIAKKSR